MKRVQISLEESVLKRMDSFSSEKGLNRSSLITLATMAYIDAQEAMPDLQKQIDELKHAMEQLTIK